MFEDTLLDSSPRRTTILRRIHYALALFTGALVFGLGLYLLPMVLILAGKWALLITAGLSGTAAALYVLMVCYVWAEARRRSRHAWPWVGLTLVFNLPGFLIYLVYSAQKTGDWKRAAIPLAYVAESMLVGVLILVPLVHTQALPRHLLFSDVHIPPPPGPPAAPPAGHPAQPPPDQHRPALDPYTSPPIIPPSIHVFADPQEQPQPQPGPEGPSVPGGVPPGWGPGGDTIVGGVPWGTSPAPPPAQTHTTPKQRMVRQGGDVTAARAIYRPSPVYPPLAMMARIQGTVVLQAILSKEGTVEDLKVLSGHPLLVRAAIDAVRVWRYQPTLLNSEPVEVLTEIDVNFRLGE